MKAQRPLVRSILALAGVMLYLPPGRPLHAATFTWDGGGATDAIAVGGNWIGDVAPTSNLATTDLIFSGTVRPTPIFGAPFSAHAVTFDNTVSPFTFTGSTLTIGTGGITNNDTNLDLITFNNAVALGANAPLNLNGGFTNFGALAMGSNVMTVTGGSSGSTSSLTGSNAIVFNGSGFFSFSVPSVQGFDITANGGVISNTADGSTDFFNASTTIAVSSAASLSLHESMTLTGSVLTSAVGSTFGIDTGKTLTLQGGATATFGSAVAQQGGSVTVTGAGSLFKINNGQSAAFSSTSTANVGAGGHLETAGGLSLAIIPGVGTLTVDGAGSVASAGAASNWGFGGGTAMVTFSNNAGGTFAALNLGTNAAGSNATVLVQSGADVTSGALNLSSNGGSSTVTITGAGSTWATNSNVVLGSSAGTTALLKVESGGSFATSSGFTTTVHPTGTITVNSATLTLGGGLNVSGRVEVLSGGGIAFGANSTVAIGSGGSLQTAGGLNLASGSNLAVTIANASSLLGAGTALSTWGLGGAASVTFSDNATGSFGALTLAAAAPASTATVNVQSGAAVSSGDLFIATSSVAGNNASLTIGGTGSSWTLPGNAALAVGAAMGGTGNLTVSTGGTFTTGTGSITIQPTGSINLTGGTFATNGDLTVQGGQFVRTGGGFTLAANRQLTVQGGGSFSLGNADLALTGTSSLTVTGAGSTVSLRILETLNAATGVNINTGGVLTLTGANAFRLGAGTATIDGNGSQLSVGSPGASYIAASAGTAALTIRVGGLGTFTNVLDVPNTNSSAATGSLTVESGGDLSVGPLTIGGGNGSSTGSATITGAGSTLTQTGTADITVGKLSGGTGTLTVALSGSVATGTGSTTINTTGTLAINGGSFQANGDLLVAGKLTRDGTGSLTFAPGKNFGVYGSATFAGNFTSFNFNSGGMLSIVGNMALLTTTTSSLGINGGSTLAVSQGGEAAIEAGFTVGVSSHGTATIDGAGSSVSVGFDYFAGGNNTSGQLTVSNNASLNVGGSYFLAVVPNSSASLNVLSGADAVAVNQLQIGTGGAAAVLVSGPGSTLTLTGSSQTTIGSFFGGNSSLTVSNGGLFTASSAGVVLRPTGVLNVAGGTASIPGPIARDGGSVNFSSGALSYVGDLSIEPGGLLGANLTLGNAQKLTLTGTTVVQEFETLTLDGGTLSTGSLTMNGTLAFKKGTLMITGAGGLEIGGGPLGGNATLSSGAILQVTNTLAVAGGAQLTLAGATLSAGGLANAGLLEIISGATTIAGPAVNQPGADFLTARPFAITGAFSNAAGGRITLLGPTGRLNGAGSLMNSGLLTGDGVIAKPFSNLAGGEVRADLGKTLRFTGANSPSAGKFNLQGGSLEFTQALTNGPSGQINGRGTLNFANGLLNQGAIHFSGGFSDVFGNLAQSGNGTVLVSGGAIATFYDAFLHNGAAVHTSTGSRTVFFGAVSGSGTFTGTGETSFEGGYSPGNSPAIVTLGNAITFAPSNFLTMEIGGLSAGPGSNVVDDGYDRLAFTSASDPAVTWGGTLRIDLINGFVPMPGQSFDLFDFDPARATGEFTAIEFVDALPAGVAFDFEKLYTTGEVMIVVPEPAATALLLLGGLGWMGVRRRLRARAKLPDSASRDRGAREIRRRAV